MRFDDILATVLTADLDDPFAARSAWRQLLDLVGRGRVPADARAIAMLRGLQAQVPLATRSASARALMGMTPPAPLVRLLASDDIGVAAPILRSAALTVDEWTALLPAISPAARAILRHRRDLPPDVVRALEAFGPVDFVIGTDTVAAAPEPVVEAEVKAEAAPEDSGPFVPIGRVAAGLPLVTEALRRGNDNDVAPPLAGTFRIADVVARIKAYQQRRETGETHPDPAPAEKLPSDRFRFETDAAGVIRWVDGIVRAVLVGHRLDRSARPGAVGVDGVAAGACRRRARFDDARLLLDGNDDVAGLWLFSAIPVFDSATGRFTGYRGSGRRPARHELPGAASADAMRQIVHELRTPTNAIAGFSDMIAQAMLGPVKDIYRVQAAEIRREATALMGAIDDVDTAARIAAGALGLRPEPVDLRAVVARITDELSQLARAREARIIVVGEPAVAMVDTRSVERVLCRLAATMLASAGRGETIRIRLSASADAIVVAVDRATALIGRSDQELLAMDDEQTSGPLLGTGFALRLSRNLAQELGGSLAIGADVLTLTLPAALDRPMEQAQHRQA